MGISTPKRSKVTVLTKPNYTGICNDNIVLFSQGKANHVCFLYTEDNKLYYMGRDYQHASYKLHKKPELIHTTFKSPLMSIQCGGFHGLLLTVNGELYSYGQNGHGQILLPEKGTQYKITHVDNIENVKAIGCLYNTSYFLDSNNELNTFGSNDFGECGVIPTVYNEHYEITKTLHVCELNKIKSDILVCGNGCHHIGFLTKKLNVYLFGRNKYGQCGKDLKKNQTVYGATKLDTTSIDGNIMDLKVGAYHTIIKTDDAEYYAFGKNDNGQCLLFIDETLISYPQKIKKNGILKAMNSKTIIDIIPGYNETFICC